MRDAAQQDLLTYFQTHFDEIQSWRHEIHKHPETAFEETRTADFVAEKLQSWGIEIHRGLAKTGIVGTIKGKTDTHGASIGLRADLDALNMCEHNTFAHKSTHEGKMHACGHDGHTTMLLAAAKYLAQHRDFDGTAYVIFQPAEEGDKNGTGGGRIMIEDGLFEKFKIDRVFGMHNWPELSVGKMAIAAGSMTASTDGFEIKVIGKGGHAGMPHLHIDSVFIAASIVTALHGMMSGNMNPRKGSLLSVCQINGGTSDSAMPESVELKGTVRCFDEDERKKIERGIEQISKSIAAAHGAKIEFKMHHGYPSVVNTENEVEMARQAVRAIIGHDNLEVFEPTLGGEDFAYMLQQKPGAYIALGQADQDHEAGLHSAHYDFNDRAIPIGAAYWVSLTKHVLAAA